MRVTPFSAFFALALFYLAQSAGAAGPALYFPPDDGPWETTDPGALRLDKEKLEAVLDYAGRNRSTSVVILHRGRILAERHWDPDKTGSARFVRRSLGRTAEGHAIEDVASVQKSIVSVLVGIALEKGLLKLDDAASDYLGKGWSRATPRQEAAITLRHLITMTSGLTESGRFEAPAGRKWRYNTWAYSQTVKVLEKASGMDRNEFTRKWLTGPLGMKDSRWAPRDSGLTQSANTHGFATSARDLARFGLMMLAGGKWKDRVILGDQEYLKASLSRSQKMNPYYGYLWWLNRDPDNPRARRVGTAPKDAFSANGALNRRCWVVPSLGLVITRLGDQPPAGRGFDQEFWRLLRAARK